MMIFPSICIFVSFHFIPKLYCKWDVLMFHNSEKSKKYNPIKKIRVIYKSLTDLIPSKIINFFKNRIVIAIFTFAVGGLIGNRFDQFFLYLIKWVTSRHEYYNFIVIILAITLLLLIWIVVSYIRLHDMILYKKPEINSNVDVRPSSDDFYKELTNLVTSSNYKKDLFISIGEGESLNDWIIRIYREYNSGRLEKPQINNINIKMLSCDLCQALEKSGYISKGYCSRMKNNINSFLNNPILKEQGININITYWNALPTFHGFIYDNYCLINSWEINVDGFLHVRTYLKEFTAEQNPDKYNSLLKEFSV